MKTKQAEAFKPVNIKSNDESGLQSKKGHTLFFSVIGELCSKYCFKILEAILNDH